MSRPIPALSGFTVPPSVRAYSLIVWGILMLGAAMPPAVANSGKVGPVPVARGFALSDMKLVITSGTYRATFQLYDTKAARDFYRQLPLDLPLTNFRNAQWMFYPPEKLGVTDHEAYHEGLKGELSYYAPWGDVFMLYQDFYARDEMHRLGIGLTGIDQIAPMQGTISIRKLED
ncbi:cyclophilin-like fold protein [Cohaesibacter haloalkalitolerans]|uniref:cyclophilin-like fold protein n=1 Tax=Cohaesibacter haloalkalitolerans TaxID=1162980 RepID=UPI0019691D79|nr:cyclophilin-like fold protein [Cohaesibacter haloalkalitolerans]